VRRGPFLLFLLDVFSCSQIKLVFVILTREGKVKDVMIIENSSIRSEFYRIITNNIIIIYTQREREKDRDN